MALTIRYLKGLGLDEEQAQRVLGELEAEQAHSGEQAQALTQAQQELTQARQEMETLGKTLAREREAFARYKARAEEAALRSQREALFRKALCEAGVAERHAQALTRASDLTRFAVRDGAFEDGDAVAEYITQEWGDFIPEVSTHGVRVQTPPDLAEPGMTRAQIMGIRDATDRQRAIADNIDRFRR